MTLSDERYVAVSTFRRSGDSVSTATWIVPLEGDRFGFWTSSRTGKYQRLSNNPKVTVQPADSRGRPKPGTSSVDGTAQLVTSGPDFDAIQSKVRAKYGLMVHISRFFNRVGHIGKGTWPYGDVGVVVTPSDHS
jgi:PPOX class probable F420-dependent enzyme